MGPGVDDDTTDDIVQLPLRSRVVWRLAEIAVVAIACVLVERQCGSTVICPGFPAILLCAAIVSAVCYFIDRPLVKRKVSLILLACMSALGVGAAYYYTTPERLFRSFVADPMPQSVRVLGCKYEGGRDPAVYVSFELSPGDLDAILRTHPYVIDPRTDRQAVFEPVSRAPWWQPESLANPTLYYWEDNPGQRQNAAWLYMNETKTKACFAHWNF